MEEGWVALVETSGKEVYVNAATVAFIRGHTGDSTQINFIGSHDHVLLVRGSVRQVFLALQGLRDLA